MSINQWAFESFFVLFVSFFFFASIFWKKKNRTILLYQFLIKNIQFPAIQSNRDLLFSSNISLLLFFVRSFPIIIHLVHSSDRIFDWMVWIDINKIQPIYMCNKFIVVFQCWCKYSKQPPFRISRFPFETMQNGWQWPLCTMDENEQKCCCC